MAVTRLLFVVLAFVLSTAPQRAFAKKFAVVAYLPEWRYEGVNWEVVSEHVTHLLLFSLEPNADGSIAAQDRLPRPELMKRAREATKATGCKLMICFGGNGRSAGFSRMVRSRASRHRFIHNLWMLMHEHQLDGVDFNWEYPGYTFGKGYMADKEVEKDYRGLSKLLAETHEALEGSGKVISMAYYPDGRQEKLLAQFDFASHVDFMHSMSYDKGGEQHSPFELAKKAVNQAIDKLPPGKCTLGLPFYGRDAKKGDWTTYEDLQLRYWDQLANPETNSIFNPELQATIGFNGVKMIEKKTELALSAGLGGVMIWEVGQDCRLKPTGGKETHGDTEHPRTCMSDEASLLLAISRAIDQHEHTGL